MENRDFFGKALLALAVIVGMVPTAASMAGETDFGMAQQHRIKAQSNRLFGITQPLKESAPATGDDYRTSEQKAEDHVLLAKGLKAEYLTREAGNATDMMVLFPKSAPTHLVTCVEGSRQDLGGGKFNPSVQRIDLLTGQVETILRGMDRCDGIRTTAWGTVLATEETDDGSAYEILDPLNVTEQTVTDRGAAGTPATVTDAGDVVKRIALPAMAWEGLAVLDNGVVIGGDELRPGTDELDTDGGAIFKFIPDVPLTGGSNITDLAASPLVSGSVYVLQISCQDSGRSSFPQYGQGCEVGQGAWVRVEAATARADANSNGATGYYRPEDLHRDPLFQDPDHPAAVRFCWTNTGNEDSENFAEVMCGVDKTPLPANPGEIVDERTGFSYLADGASYAIASVNRFVEGDGDFNSFDNLDFQPETGILYVIEDHDNGDIFACLPDGGDRDIKTDGCVKVISVKDTSAEPTGFFFSPVGRTAYLSIQHSDDGNMPLFDGYRTDDVLIITGFKVK